jgi:uncharacterized protein (TIGR03067 family)
VKNLAAVFLLVLPSVSASARGDDAKSGSKPLDGTWRPQSAELAGKPYPDQILKAIKLVLNKDKYLVEIGDQTDEGTCSVDSTQSPNTLDIKGTKGPNEGKTFLCIYELKGDTLRVCYDLSGKARPTEFATKAGTKLYLVTYKREKP